MFGPTLLNAIDALSNLPYRKRWCIGESAITAKLTHYAMGQWLAKFYSTINEDIIQTPCVSHEGHQHRVLNLDPRSPSFAIPRTPIEVESTPKQTDKEEFVTPRATMQTTKKIEGLHQRFLKKQSSVPVEIDGSSSIINESNVHQKEFQRELMMTNV